MYGGGFTGWELSYNGKFIGAHIGRNGYFVTPLAPGSYELSELYHRSSGSIGSGLTSTSTSRMPLKTTFTVKRGEITNLGEIFILKRSKSSKEYKIIYVENDKDMKSYLKVFHKDVYSQFNNKPFRKSTKKYINKKGLNAVRNITVMQSPYHNQYVSVSPLGTIAITNRNSSGKIKSLKYVNTGTFNNPYNCKFTKTKTACIIPSFDKKDKLFFANKRKYVLRNKPKIFTGGNFHMLKDDSILWLDHNFSFSRTNDYGKSWKVNNSNKRVIEVRGFWDTFTKLARLQNVTDGKNGFYITSLSDIKNIIYSPYKAGKDIKIPIPADADGIETITETAKGLYAKTDETSYFSNSTIFFKAHNSNKWLKRVIPKSICRKIDIDNYAAGSVIATCRDNLKFKTNDLGKTWSQIK